MKSNNSFRNFISAILIYSASGVFFIHCSSSSTSHIPEVGQNFCMDLDEDGVAGYYKRDSLDSDEVLKSLKLLSCDIAKFDCNDSNASIFPGAIEIADDTIDQDCDNLDYNTNEHVDTDVGGDPSTPDCEDGSSFTTYYLDDDADSFGVADVTIAACELPEGYAILASDCDDSNADIHPNAIEIVGDSIDQDCDGEIDTLDCDSPKTYFLDADGDGYRGDTYISSCLRPASNYYLATEAESEGSNTFCGSDSDSNKYKNPGMVGKDYGYLVYQPNPNDSARWISASSKSMLLAFAPSSISTPNIFESSSRHTASAFTLPDTFTNELGLPETNQNRGIISNSFLNIDNDCDGETDEDGDHKPENTYVIGENYNILNGVYFNQCDGQGVFKYYVDNDTDGYGDENDSDPTDVCFNTSHIGTSLTHDDCNDELNLTNPGQENDYNNSFGQIQGYNNEDNDCDGQIDENNVKSYDSSHDNYSIAWNGHKFVNDSNTNKEHKKVGSYFNPNFNTKDNSKYKYSGKISYIHGGGNGDDYNYKYYYSVMKMNPTYGNFWYGKLYFSFQDNEYSVKLNDNALNSSQVSCDVDSNNCNGSVTIQLNTDDLIGKSYSENLTSEHRASVFLRGYQFTHVDAFRYFGDQHVEVWLKNVNIDNSTVELGFKINIKGTIAHDLTATVPFTILLYDPQYIDVVTFDRTQSGFINNALIQNVDRNIQLTSFNPPDNFDCDELNDCTSTKRTVGIVNQSWGFNLDESFKTKEIKALSYLKGWSSNQNSLSTANIKIKTLGTAQHGNQSEVPNEMKSRVIICANTNVCQIQAKTDECNVSNEGNGFGLTFASTNYCSPTDMEPNEDIEF